MNVVGIQRISDADRGETIFRDVFPDAPYVPALHETHQVMGVGDYLTDREAVIAAFKRAAPDDWFEHWAVLQAQEHR